MIANTLSFDGRDRSYYLYIPPAAVGEESPLLVLLHGSGGEGSFMIGRWKADADSHAIVLLAPNALANDAWRLSEDKPDYIRAVIAAAAAQTRIDPRRIYLFGQSGGAVYALELAMLESQYFAAVAVHAGGWRQPDEFNAVSLAKRKTPVKILLGDRDEYFAGTDVRRTIDRLKHDGFPAELELLPGQYHAYTAENAPGINASAWSFVSSHKLDADPVFARYRFAPEREKKPGAWRTDPIPTSASRPASKDVRWL